MRTGWRDRVKTVTQCVHFQRGKLILCFHSVDRNKYQIQIPLPPKIDASVTMMQVEEKPDVTYSDAGGCKEQIKKLREVVELPLLSVLSTLSPAVMHV
jgi:ATP-dependent 26S proteasome regulatory subunit